MTEGCDDSLRELQRFLDGELDDHACAEVLAHLDECIECYHAYDFQAELRQVIAAKCAADPVPAGLLDRLVTALTGEIGHDMVADIAGGESGAPAVGS